MEASGRYPTAVQRIGRIKVDDEAFDHFTKTRKRKQREEKSWRSDWIPEDASTGSARTAKGCVSNARSDVRRMWKETLCPQVNKSGQLDRYQDDRNGQDRREFDERYLLLMKQKKDAGKLALWRHQKKEGTGNALRKYTNRLYLICLLNVLATLILAYFYVVRRTKQSTLRWRSARSMPSCRGGS